MSRHSVMMPCDSTTRLLELLVLLDQHWSFSKLKYPICLVSRTGREILTFVRSMMEWLGGTISKEDVGEESEKQRRKKREAEHEDEALGALSLRFRFMVFACLNLRSPADAHFEQALRILHESTGIAKRIFIKRT